ncbi:MAG: dicarboxylate/amino acid:cation symporter [Oscillospiraceae bacterium]|nr:dicarboxylate/amino acid:cation symporter [Oscillospiraceae bacterium]
MALVYQEYTLDRAAVEEISAALQAHLAALGLERNSVHRLRLTAEELLLNLMSSREEGSRVSVGLGRQFGRQLFRLRYEGPPLDPTENSDDSWAGEMMRALGFSPAWNCRGRVNTVSLVLADRPKRGAVFYILLAVLAAALLGFAGSFLPEALRRSLDDVLFGPVTDGFVGLLNTFSGLMIFLTVCSGIQGMGDPAALGRTGKSVLLRFVGLSFAISVASAALVLPFLKLGHAAGATGESAPLSQLSRLFFGILPSNLVEPFQTGNALQIIVISLFAGVGLLALGERGNRLRGLIEEAASLQQRIVSAICALVPVFVFVMLLRLIWSGQGKELLFILKPLLLSVGTILVLSAVLWLLSALRLKCRPTTLLRKVLPPFLTALTTASSMSALPLGMETCEKKLGVRGSTVSFLYPLGTVIYMPADTVYFTVLACTFAEAFQLELSLSWLCMAVVISTLLAIALPPIPGSGILCYSILFSNLGVPAEAIALASAMDMVMDLFDTGFNVMLLQFQIACEAKRLDSLDRETLMGR